VHSTASQLELVGMRRSWCSTTPISMRDPWRGRGFSDQHLTGLLRATRAIGALELYDDFVAVVGELIRQYRGWRSRRRVTPSAASGRASFPSVAVRRSAYTASSARSVRRQRSD